MVQGTRRILWIIVIGLWVVGCAILAIGGGFWWARRVRVSETIPVAVLTETSPVVTVPPAPTDTPTPTPTSTATLEPITTPTLAASPESTLDATREGASDSITSIGDTLILPTATPTPSPAPTPSPTPEPIAVAPTSTPVTAPICPSPGVQITSPRPGARFTTRYNYIVGTANINRFHHWKLEYSTNPNGSWTYLLERDYPVDNDKLAMIDASTIPRGPYGLRLTVVDETGNYPEPCEVWYTNAY